VLPSAVLLGSLGWSRLLELLPVKLIWKQIFTGILALVLLSTPYKFFNFPVPLEGTQRIVKDASDWMLKSEYAGTKFFYFNPFFPHFLNANPHNGEDAGYYVPDRDKPEKSVKEGEIVIWDAHFAPNEGALPLKNLMDNRAFKLIHLTREKEARTVLGGYSYEIYFFERIAEEEAVDNHALYGSMLEEILNSEH
ncbi:MAG: hypothetical protein QNK35_08350, partial [Bacteroides sp.]|nr:hypothetical protein [Bacteroides sp.]